MRKILLLFLVLSGSFQLMAQIPTDGLLMPTKSLCTGFMFQQDQWNEYWEGSLRRNNGNIGTLTTQSVMWYGVYGVNTRLNLMAMAPYVKTKASAGTMQGMQGVQDLTIAAKYQLIEAAAGPGRFMMFAGASVSVPLTNYAPDYLPFSIGSHAKTIAGRINMNYTSDLGLYLNTSGGYTFRSNILLDRPEYYTDGQYYATDEVDMPNVFDFKLDVGYHKGPIQGELSYSQMKTLGGGDIRRQDMPFPSNRMNAGRLNALVMYYVPWPKNFGVRGMLSETLAGQNVGKTRTYMVGVLYTIYFSKSESSTTPTN
jgi:hypothetical protein